MKKILFLCTGNICRSSTAKAIAEKIVKDLAVDTGLPCNLLFDSAGISGYHAGESSDSRAIKIAAKNDVDLSRIRARQVTQSDFTDFDHIFCMDEGHLETARRISPPKYHDKIQLFLNFAKIHNSEVGIEEAVGEKVREEIWAQEVPDPYYSDESAFKEMFDLLYVGVNQMMKKLASRN